MEFINVLFKAIGIDANNESNELMVKETLNEKRSQ